MTTVRKCVHITNKWVVILIALTTGITVLLQTINFTPASAISDNYPWPNAPCASSGSNLGQTSGTGYWCSNYNWGQSTCPAGDNYCTTGNKMNGYYQYDQWGEGFRNCVSYTSWMLSQTFNVNPSNWGNGTDWNNSALAAHYTDDSSPQIGDVAQWNGTKQNQWGHVAYVYNVVGNVAYYAEYNYAADGNFLNTYTSTTQGSPNNYIHIGTPSSAVPRVSALQFGGSEMDAYKLASNGTISKDTYQTSSGTWGGWGSMGTPYSGGTFTSDPVAIQFNSEMDVYALGSDSHVYKDTWQPSNNSWSGWNQLGSGVTLAGTPSAVQYGSGEMDVYVRGTNGQLYKDTWQNSSNSWNGWNSMGGNIAGNPKAMIYNGSEMDIYVRGTDNALWKDGWNGSSWGGFSSMGGVVAGDPAPIQYNSEMDFFVNTPSGTMFKQTWNGSSWSGWVNMPGITFGGSPSALQYGSEMDVYARGTSDSHVYEQTWNGTNWSGWNNRGGLEAGDPTAIQFSTEMDVFATNGSSNTDKDTWLPANNSWSGFLGLL